MDDEQHKILLNAMCGFAYLLGYVRGLGLDDLVAKFQPDLDAFADVLDNWEKPAPQSSETGRGD